MLKRYLIKDQPALEIIAVSDLKKLKDADFLLIRVKAGSEDEINDIIEEVGLLDIPVACIVTTMENTAHEIVEKIENGK